jgi:hypothetical protein
MHLQLHVYILFVTVAVIVSLDVAGLTISKAVSLRNDQAQRIAWAVTNGFWHALLLAVYAFTIINLFQFLTVDFTKIVNIFKWLANLLAIISINLLDVRETIHEVLDFIKKHIPLFFGLFALTVVWITYDRKIVSTPAVGNWRDLPPLARVVYGLIEAVTYLLPFLRTSWRDPQRVANFLRWQAEAALVAVDMLALAVLMAKMKYIESDLNKFILIGLVFFTVSILALLVSRWSIRLLGSGALLDPCPPSSSPQSTPITERDWWQVAFRLMEPWFIFYFALELIGYLLYGKPVHSVGFIFGASLLLFALMQKHEMRRIIEAATMPVEQDTGTANVESSIRKFRDIGGDFLHLLKIVVKIILGTIAAVFVVALLWRFVGRIIASPELDAAVTGIAGTISLIALAASHWFPRVYIVVGHVINWFIANRKVFPFFIGALAVATIVPIYEEVSEQGGNMKFTPGEPDICRIVDLGFKENHLHALQVAILFSCLWLLSYYLAKRLDRFAEARGKGAGAITWNDLVESSGAVPFNRFDVREVTQILMFWILLGTIVISVSQQKLYTSLQPCFALVGAG